MLGPMYNEFFGLKHEPFSIAPDPHYLFMSERHREALAHLLYGVRSGGGFVLLTGEIGAGKTTVCRCFLEKVPRRCNVAYIFNPRQTVEELLESICHDFRIARDGPAPERPLTARDHVAALNDFLLRTHGVGQNNVLIIDEAQSLSAEVLEQLRLLTNLETNERKLLQIILIGQPELRDMLARPELEQLAQRVIARYHLEALTARETTHYIQHRLAVAGLSRAMPFDAAAMQRIHALSRGVPRRINLLCDRALLGAYASGKAMADLAIVDKAAAEVLGQAPGRSRGRLGLSSRARMGTDARSWGVARRGAVRRGLAGLGCHSAGGSDGCRQFKSGREIARMSYILEALRKADAERERGTVPDLHTQLVPGGPADAEAVPSRASRWLGPLLGAAVVLVGVVAWRLLVSEAPSAAVVTPAVTPQAPPAPSQAVTAAAAVATASPAPPASAVAAAAAPVAQATPPSAPAPTKSSTTTPTPTQPQQAKAAAAPAGDRVRAAPTATPAARAGPTVAKSTAAAPKRIAADPPTGDARPTLAATPAAPAAVPRLPRLNELPDEFRQQVPQLAIGGSMYSPQAAKRMVIVNGQVFLEGATLAPELQLEQIRPRTAVFSIRGQRFEVPL